MLFSSLLVVVVNFDPCGIDTTQPITKTFIAVDYVGETNPCARFSADQSTGASVELGEFNENLFYLYPVF